MGCFFVWGGGARPPTHNTPIPSVWRANKTLFCIGNNKLRAICIHGHFYQPPREDPLTGLIPHEMGAAPYHNWNERIHKECYRPNAELGNFERISFNIGPTLFAWMAGYDQETCRSIIAQDQANVQQFGVGNAMAQAYNHTILPLASREDKVTQVAWGVADFEARFGRKPQGMWLPETAVDLETLEVLAEHGIEYTILAPWQSNPDTIDPTEPYRVQLPGGKSITVFFYHRELSAGISFNPSLTTNADVFAQNELSGSFNPEKAQRGEPQLVMVASDGELYGHHQQFRDRFLAHLVNGASAQVGLVRTFPGLWLKDYPARRSTGINERTSWSCYHGVTRWMGACSCTPGDGRWKAYLRRAFNRLAAAIDAQYVEALRPMGMEGWAAASGLRNGYIHVLLGQMKVAELVQQVAKRRLPQDDVERVRLLLEAQRERQRMFTSCGWYFEDFSRIEPRNNVAYAAQAVYLTRLATGVDLSYQVMGELRQVVSHRTGLRADLVYQKKLQEASGGL